MRIVLIGASSLTIESAWVLLEQGHEVVIVEQDEARLRELDEMELDCGLVHGDGSRPAVLSELGPEETQFLFCMSGSDQDNILSALAGKALGFEKVVAKIEAADFEGLCDELGLEDVLIPSQEAANAVSDRVAGVESVDLAPLMRTGIRFFAFAAGERDAGPVSDVELPDGARILAITRRGEGVLCDGETRIEEHDKVYVVCSQKQVRQLRERFLED